jgi:hypothetical protein
MPVVFVLAHDWTLRTAVRAELREIGVEALGMDSPDDAGKAIAAGGMPAAVVLEAAADFVSDSAVQNLISVVPTILIASRTEKIPVPPAPPDEPGFVRSHGVVLYRPVPVAEIVSRVRDFLQKGQAA